MTDLVVSVVGPDRAGIVSEIAEIATRYEANWLESHMARLAGQFAGILQLSVAEAQAEPLRQALAAHSGEGLTIHVNEGGATPPGERRVHLQLVGQDHPGIVHDIARVLRETGISIESFESRTSSASMAGGELFEADAILALPKNIESARLEPILRQLSESLMVDILLDDTVD